MSAPKKLELFNFPLHGQRLIEASAGTGKTFTIAGLYLRLLLGHGKQGIAHSTALRVDQILVVTFTEAATEELRDRIRKRIYEARRAFERGSSCDPILQTLLDDSQDHAEDAITLLNAERQMDEAAIYTIHSFCQRMLKQNAFESGSLFVQEIITEEDLIKLQATADFWRREFYSANKSLASVIRGYWSCPKVLLARIKSYLSGPLPKINAPDMPDSLGQLHEKNLAAVTKLKHSWCSNALEIEDLIVKNLTNLNGNSYKKASVPFWLEEISQWAASSTSNYGLPEKLDKFSAQNLEDKTKKAMMTPKHAVFDEIEAFLAQKLDFEDRLTKFAITQVREILAKEKYRHSWLSFDDLLSNLANALNNDSDSELAKRIRELYPVAMIDEFQDTDPEQYTIFSTIYSKEPRVGLFMIGDPKQAIYAFRGADIFTYIGARQAVSDHYNLDTNWRSSADMVAAANRIFEMGTAPFIYDKQIPFLPVKPAKGSNKKYWQYNGQKQAALTLWFDETNSEPLSQEDYQANMAEACAVHIRDLLTASNQGNAAFYNKDTASAIKPSDIAVLVRTGKQASFIKKELAKRGIVSVYLSDRNSVFSSSVAKDLDWILNAVINPENEQNLRSALACSLFALSAKQIDELNHDEKIWELAANEFKKYQEIWFNKGILPMLRQLIFNRKIAQRLLSENAERELTDLMHIGELLQKASNELDSHYALIRWLKDNIDAPNGNSEGQQVRLESERDLVKIVTIHKSKGLEYNLVYLPFISMFKPTKAPFYHDDEHQAVLELVEKEQALEKAEKERLAEDLRLLYVAITRAVYGCILGMSAIKVGKSSKALQHLSAIGYLLQQGEEKSATGLHQDLQALVNGQDNMLLCPLPLVSEGKYIAHYHKDSLTAKTFSGEIRRDWRLSSYSNLVKQGHKLELDIPTFDIDAANEEQTELIGDFSEQETVAELAPFSSIFQFPKGARPGTFIHTLFENIAFNADMQSQEVVGMLHYQLMRENYEEQWTAVLQSMLNNVVSTSLNSEGLKLAQVDEANRINELEFMMSAQNVNAYSLNQLIKKHDSISAKANNLDFSAVTGMLKGFIDLVFCWQGKYYVLDWKSNYLGDKAADYNQSALQQAMLESRYDLQYQLYTLALHRFLRSRIADYSYEKHIGGVFYLFVRGIEADSTNGIFQTKPKKELIEQLDILFADGVQHAG